MEYPFLERSSLVKNNETAATPEKKYHGGWANMTPEQRERRIRVATKKRIATMRKNRRMGSEKPKSTAVVRVESPPPRREEFEMVLPPPIGLAKIRESSGHLVEQHSEEDINVLGKLIAATWKAMRR